jgi:3,4-dihydroxy 2-butanone 4-phosphate synthase/GTP cyclohydrolase II
MKHDSLIVVKEDFEIKTRFGNYRLKAYQQTTNNQIHIALTKGVWNEGDQILTRINSTQSNNDLIGLLTQSNQNQIDSIFETIQKEGKGAVIFINQEVKTFNLLNRLQEIKKLQSEGIFEIPQIPMDTKDFGYWCTNFARFKYFENQINYQFRTNQTCGYDWLRFRNHRIRKILIFK